MRLEHRAGSDMSFSERSWRNAPAGELIDQDGGMIAGDVFARMQTLMARLDGTNRWNKAQALPEGYNEGLACQYRQDEIKRAQAEFVRVFGR